MLSVLNDRQEVLDAIEYCKMRDLPLHRTEAKNWDHSLLHSRIDHLAKDAQILDLGMGDAYTLEFIHKMLFTNISGIDLNISFAARVKILKMHLSSGLKRKPKAIKGDMITAPFSASQFDFISSLSAIEHGVDVPALLRTAYRLLKSGGELFISTDYWESGIKSIPNNKPYGLSWTVHSKSDIMQILSVAREIGFYCDDPDAIPPCNEPVIYWNQCRYAFIAMNFIKPIPPA